MFVLVQHTAQAIMAVAGQMGDPVRFRDRFG
jgi:hypothetical protein